MKFFQIFSRRQGKSAPGSALDPEGWQVGDWAECIGCGRWFTRPDNVPHPGPRHGQSMRVTSVEVHRDPMVPGKRVLTLAFAGWPGANFDASNFRKLRPRADETTAAEAEFTQLLRRKPAPALPTTLPAETIEEFQ